MRFAFSLLIVCVGLSAVGSAISGADASAKVEANEQMTAPLDVKMQTLDGKDVNLANKYKGQVVLLVNVASKCGLTKQYEPMQKLHDKYAEKGLAIIGVPCNQFGEQEPGTSSEIATFCRDNFGVKFDMLSKVDVNVANACPLYKKLTSKESNPKMGGPIKWNFEKFLFNREGQLIARFQPQVLPDSDEVVSAIEAELAKSKNSRDSTAAPN